MLFDMGPMELLAIVVLAVLVFGPDKLPKLIKDAATFIRKVREFSDSAKEDIRKELGPDYQDFEFEDLKPKNFVRKHVLSEVDRDDYGLGELKSLKDDLELDELRESLSLRKEDFSLTGGSSARRARGADGGAEPEADGADAPAKVSFTKKGDGAPDAAPAPSGGPALAAGERPPFDMDAT